MPSSDQVGQAVGAVAAYALPGGLRSRKRFPTRPVAVHDTRSLVDALVKHRMIGFASAAAAAGDLPTTEAQREELRRVTQYFSLRALWLEGVMLGVVRSFADHRIPVRVLKGAALAHAVYDHPSLRPYGDIDVLVPTESFDDAILVLQASGAVRVHGEPRAGFVAHFGKSVELRRTDSASIDLHRSLAPGPFAVMITSDALFAHVLHVPLQRATIPALDPVGRFVHACFHATIGNPNETLLPIRDVVQTLLAPGFEAEAALALARMWKAEAVVASALLLAWDRLAIHGDAPLAAWARRYRPTDREQAVIRSSAGVEEDARGMREVAEMVRAIPGLNNKLTYLGALFVPGDDYLAERQQTHRSRLTQAFRRIRPATAPEPVGAAKDGG